MMPPAGHPVDDAIVRAMGALASPSRLHVLRQLRTPRALGEIEIQADAEERSRNLTRQVVRKHLDRLLETGMVMAVSSGSDARSPLRYVVNHQALFLLSEEIRELAHLRPSIEPHLQTRTGAFQPHAAPRAPCLVIVRGLKEGTVFPLAGAPRDGWVMGRSRDADVPLDFDPFVSGENSRIRPLKGSHVLEDAIGSRNGTLLNFLPLPKGSQVALKHGDVIGVGRTLLVYRGE